VGSLLADTGFCGQLNAAFEHVTSWLKDLRAHADENVSIIRAWLNTRYTQLTPVVANKTDLCSSEAPTQPSISYGQAIYTDVNAPSASSSPSPPSASPGPDKNLLPRAVSANEGALFAKEHDLLYVETSAKEGWGVLSAFEWTAREALKRHNEDELARRKVSRRHAV